MTAEPVGDDVQFRSDMGVEFVELAGAAAQGNNAIWAAHVSTVGVKPIEATGSVNHSQTLNHCDSRPWTTSASERDLGVAA